MFRTHEMLLSFSGNKYAREYCSILNSAGDGTFQIRLEVFRENKNNFFSRLNYDSDIPITVSWTD
jgi:hypothetical protein